MCAEITRREFAAGILVGPIASLSVAKAPSNLLRATSQELSPDAARLERLLAKPFAEPDRRAAEAAVKAIAEVTLQRLKKTLPEGSEPCTEYRPVSAKARK